MLLAFGRGLHGFMPFSKKTILKIDFWATIWSQRPQNTSTDSLNVSLQVSKKIFMYPSFFTWRTLLKIPLLFEKKKRKNEKFFENLLENVLSYSEIYFGPPRTIWSLRNRFSKFFSSKNRETHVTAPLISYLRNIQTWNMVMFCHV